MGLRFYRRGFLEAAEDFWRETVFESSMTGKAHIFDGLGRIAAHRRRAEEALRFFRTAEDEGGGPAAISMRLAMALSLVGERDQAFRQAARIVRQAAGCVPDSLMVGLLINLAGMRLNLALFPAAVESLTLAKGLAGADLPRPYRYALDVNLGLAWLGLNRREDGQQAFQRAIEGTPDAAVGAINGLAQLSIKNARWDDVRHYGEMAFERMWRSLWSFDNEEMADLAFVGAEWALTMDQGRSAVRFFDIAQTLYGRAGRWERWQSIQSLMARAETRPHAHQRSGEVAEELTRFLVMLESILAQDILDPGSRSHLDVRHGVSKALAEALHFSAQEMEQLTHVSRLADLGLTAVGNREESSPLFRLHPEMSVRLLDRLALPEPVRSAIRSHHERWDGRGFPDGVSGAHIPRMARLLHVTDWYARDTTAPGGSHRHALRTIEAEAGKAFGPAVVSTFTGIFGASSATLNP